jgi:glycosyltransferase involved in cell wall biosynthesis
MLESLRLQRFGRWECRVVIDGRDEVAERIAVEHAAHDPRIAVTIVDRHIGLPAARNLAVRDTKAGWVLPFDADDWMDPDYLLALHDAAESTPDDNRRYNVFFTPARMVWDDRAEVFTYPAYDRSQIADVVQLPGCSMMPRALYDRLRGYDEAWDSGATDWMFWVRAAAIDVLNPVQVFPASWNYRQHNGFRNHHRGVRHLKVLQEEMRRALRGDRAYGEPLPILT